MGRKAAKKARSRSSSAGEDLFAEHFKEMQVDNRGYYDQVEAKRSAEAVAARKELEAFRVADAERKLRFKAQELEERRRQREELRETADKKYDLEIMKMRLEDAATPEARMWLVDKQTEIFEKNR